MAESPSKPNQADLESQSDSHEKAPRAKRGSARRLGCGIALVCWFTLLLTPCAFFYLAANGEIRLEHRDIPQGHAHPFLLISLVSEVEDRGLRIENSWFAGTASTERLVCVETAVRFILWEYSGGNQNVNFCDCYQRQDAGLNWDLVSTHSDAC